MQDLLSVLGPSVRRLVLTRNHARDFTGHGIHLDAELSPADAIELLRKLSPQYGTDAQLTEIVELLEGNPLALTNAGCQLANSNDEVDVLLAELRATRRTVNVAAGESR